MNSTISRKLHEGTIFNPVSYFTDEDSIEEEKPKIKTNKLSTKKKFKKNNFIDDEAELSGLASSDEEMDNQSEFESSFVDDGTQQVSKDQTAIYLQSIKSPPKRKMITNSKPTMAFEDIYSQPVTDTMLYDDYDMSGTIFLLMQIELLFNSQILSKNLGNRGFEISITSCLFFSFIKGKVLL